MAHNSLRSVLVVDDDPIHCEIVGSTLRQWTGAQVIVAANGKALLQIVEERGGDIDLILCDLNMPEFDGIEFIMHLSRKKLPCALVIVSGARPEIVKAADRLAFALGLNYKGFLSKPVDFKALEALLGSPARIET